MCSNALKKFAILPKYADFENNPWVEFGELAARENPVNLGQGFPDYFPPDYVAKFLKEVASSDNPLIHQYTRSFGHPRLVKAIAKLYSTLLERDIDPYKEILITCGAYEALYCIINGQISEGDEVIIIEPYFDCYEPMVKAAGGTARFIPLKCKPSNPADNGNISANDWKFDEEELRSLFNQNTKMIIVNTPHNPLGKIFSMDELMLISELCIQYNVLCLSDEVYEWIVYEPNKHIRMATLPGMWERTVTIGSAGKTFSITGWKLGWMYGPDYLIKTACIVHQNNVYTYNTPIQEAIARCFENEIDRIDQPDCYFNSISRELLPKRDYFVNIMKKAGFTPTVPEGGYFLIADWSGLENWLDLSSETDECADFRFAKWTSKNVKVQGIPPSVFYSKPHKFLVENYIRYCFFKKDETLKDAAANFEKWQQRTKL